LGVSRSATIIIGYVMAKKSLPLKESYEMLKAVREAVQPNRGFLRCLFGFLFWFVLSENKSQDKIYFFNY
jgi:protein-tyrosine phosphatase